MSISRIFALLVLAMAVPRPLAAQIPERDRLLNCYYDARARDAAEARGCLEQLIRQYPQDLQALTELGFFEIAQDHPDAAMDAFTRAVQAGTRRADVFAQLGYLHLARGEREDALKNFRASSEIDPSNEQVRMQTAYVLDALGRKKDAAALFNGIAATTTDDARRRQACGSAEILAPLTMKQLPSPYFVDIYTAPDYYSNIETATLPLRVRGGVGIGSDNPTEVFGQLAVLADNRSSASAQAGPVIYFDNVLTLGGGVTQRFQHLPGVILSTTIGEGYDLIYQNRDRWRFDLRAGGEYYNAWGIGSRCPASITFPFRPVLEIYGSSIYFTRYDDLISSLRVRPGLRVLETARTSLDVNLHLAGVADTAGLDYNNLFEIGGGVIFAPDRHLGIRFGMETVRREFQGGHHDVVTRVRIEYSARF